MRCVADGLEAKGCDHHADERTWRHGQDDSTKPSADQILTPSFISTDMRIAAKLRQSDLLLKKKEPSVQAQGDDTFEVNFEDYVSSAFDHSMCSDGQCAHTSSLSMSQASVNKNERITPIVTGRPDLHAANTPPVL